MSRSSFALLLTLVWVASNLDVFAESVAREKDNCPATSKEHGVAWTEEQILAQAETEAVSAVSLLQTSSVSYRHLYADSGRCKLKFMHIPKNMGGTISNFSQTNDMNLLINSLRLIHPNEYGIPGVGEVDGLSCIQVHTPPAFHPEPQPFTLATALGDEVFCITRNPYERAISLYDDAMLRSSIETEVHNPETCTKEALNEKWQHWIRRYLDGHRGTHGQEEDCKLYPQSLMIYGPDESKQWCQHILRHDEMPGAFNQLLNESGCDRQFEDDGRYNMHTKKVCPNLSVTDLTNKTIAMLNAHYRKDFELLGYELQ